MYLEKDNKIKELEIENALLKNQLNKYIIVITIFVFVFINMLFILFFIFFII
jgi:hypothetical protein